ncbi:MAG: C40 family peptidase [Bacteroidales bacterium]|nr:C40 family peptidase [Bacteroidales bacterium]
MKLFICQHLYIPLRTGPSHRAEMGSQILFGERYEVVDTAGSYSLIRLLFDNYHGWIDNDHVIPVKADIDTDPKILAADTRVRLDENPPLILPAGSELYAITGDRMGFTNGTLSFRSDEPLITAPLTGNPVKTASRYLNIPYLWGGRTYMGMDCSGLVQTVYKVHGVSLPRDSFIQAEAGTTINMLNESLPGDLLFFDNKQGKITHVGMLYSEGVIIHCSGSVRLDIIDHQGIFRRDLNRYTHRLRLIKRVF